MQKLRVVGIPENVAIGAASVQSSLLSTMANNGGAQAVLVSGTVACRIRIGANPTAVAADTHVPANWPMVFKMMQSERLAVIQEGAVTGNLSVSPVMLPGD